MSDYTPTTEQVCEGYSYDPEAEYRDPITNHAALNRQAFNRWLAEHDKQEARKERERLYKIVFARRVLAIERFEESDGYESHIGNRYGGIITGLEESLVLIGGREL